MYKYVFPFLLLIVTAGLNVSGNPVNIDSLKSIANDNSKNDTVRIDAMYKLAKIYADSNNYQSLYFANHQLQLSKKHKDFLGALNALEIIINYFDAKNSYDISLRYCDTAIEIAQQAGYKNDLLYFSGVSGSIAIKKGDYFEALEKYTLAVKIAQEQNRSNAEASFLNNIGSIYNYLGDNLKALDYYIAAYDLKEKNGKTGKLPPALINIGGLYVTNGDTAEGLVFLKKALKYAAENNDNYSVAKASISIGNVHMKYGHLDSAFVYYTAAMEAARKQDDLTVSVNLLIKLSGYYYQTGKQTKAIQFAEKAFKESEEIDYKFGIVSAAQQLGSFYFRQGKFKKAAVYFTKALNVSNKINAVDGQLNAYKSLYELYKRQMLYKKAMQNYSRYVQIKDSIFNEQSRRKYSAVKARYEINEKQRELEKIKLENEINRLHERQSRYILWGALSLSLLIFLIIIIIYRQQKIRTLQKVIKLEQKLLRSRLNPHFIFNALTAVQRFIFEKNPLAASDFLGNFSRLIRFVLHNASSDRISLKEELEFIENYLNLQAIRFDNTFSFIVKVDDDVDCENTFIPPMIVQPIVENAVEHGIKHSDKKGFIRVEFKLKNKIIEVVVTDNGVGRKRAAEIQKRKNANHRSVSTQITKERITRLNKKGKKGVSVEIIDLRDDNSQPAGTKVILRVPVVVSK